LNLARLAATAGLALLLGVGCQAAKYYKTAERHQLAGRDYMAASAYLSVLAKKPGHNDALIHLGEVAQAGYQNRYNLALSKERNQQYREAGAIYDELARFTDKLDNFDVLDWEIPNLRAKADGMRDAAVALDFSNGQEALENGQWGKAFDYFAKVEKHKPHYPGLRLAQTKAWFGSASDNEANGKYRKAAEEYLAAVEALGKPYEGSVQRASKLLMGLGRYHYVQGNCRQAWRDLEVASKISTEPGLAGEVTEAWACAETGIVVQDLRKRFRNDVLGLDVPGLIRANVLEKAAERKSQFIVFLDNQRIANPAQVDFSVTGELLEVFTDSDTRRDTALVDGIRRFVCQKTDANSQPYEDECDETVQLKYEKVWRTHTAHITGSVRLVHERSGVLSNRQLGRAVTSETHFAGDFRDPDDSPVSLVLDPQVGFIAVSQDTLNLANATQEPTSERDLVRQAIDDVSEQITTFLLNGVDTEVVAEDPMKLDY